MLADAARRTRQPSCGESWICDKWNESKRRTCWQIDPIRNKNKLSKSDSWRCSREVRSQRTVMTVERRRKVGLNRMRHDVCKVRLELPRLSNARRSFQTAAVMNIMYIFDDIQSQTTSLTQEPRNDKNCDGIWLLEAFDSWTEHFLCQEWKTIDDRTWKNYALYCLCTVKCFALQKSDQEKQ